ncbi:hypothetical protein ABH970_000152 [Bradyrhizobium ottawaense]
MATLGMGRGARRRAEDRDVLALGGIDQPVVELRLPRGTGPAELGKALRRHQPGIVVFPHPARIGIDDVLQLRRAVGEGEQLVDLLLVLGEDELRLAIVEEIGSLLVQHVAIKSEAEAADGVRRHFRRHPVRPVVADDADDVAAAKAHFEKTERKVAHAGLVVAPGEQPPEPEILLAQCDLVAMLLRIEPEHLRIGVGLCDAACVIHHAALSCAGAASSGSTSTSSSSPR